MTTRTVEELEEELLKRERAIGELESQLRQRAFTIELLEAENKALTLAMTTPGARKRKVSRKKKKKAAKAGAGKSASPDQDEEEEEGGKTDPTILEQIAEAFPAMTLAAFLRAEAEFQEADADGSGAISATELDKYLTKHGHVFSTSQVQDILKEIDESHDGEVDFFEYVQFLQILEDQKVMKERRSQMSASTSAAVGR